MPDCLQELSYSYIGVMGIVCVSMVCLGFAAATFLHGLANAKNQQQLEPSLLESSLQKLPEVWATPQHKWSRLIEYNPIAVVEMNTAFEITDWNAAAVEMFGYSKPEVLGLPIFDVTVPPELRSQIEQLIGNLFKSKPGNGDHGHRTINQNMTKEGRVLTCEWYSAPVFNAEGVATGAISMALDITQRHQAEKELQQSTQAVTNILGSLGDAFFSLNHQWQFTYVNAKAGSLLKRQEADLLGQNIWDEFPEAIDSTFYSAYHRAMAENLPVAFEAYYPPLETWFEVHAYPFEDGLSVDFRDINDRKRTETDLGKSQEILQSVINTIPQFIFWKDCQSVFLGCNQNFAKACGLNSPSGVIGKTDYDFAWSKEEAEQFRAIDAQVIASDTPLMHVVEPFQNAENQEVWLDYSKFPLHDAEGTVVGVLCMYEDITERRLIDQQIRTSQIFLDSVLNGTSDPIFVKDERHRWVLVNDALCALMGRRSEELIGKSDYDFLPPEQAAVFWEKDSLVLATGEENVNEEVLTDTEGHCRYISTKKTCFQDASGNRFLIGTIRDITDRKRSELLLQQAKEQLELRVEERTTELQQLVAQLEQEVQERRYVETQLRESKQMMDIVFDTLPQRVFWKDRNFNYLGCNKKFAQDAGLESPEQIIGKSDFELSWKHLAPLYRADDAAIMEANTARLNFEEPFSRDDGAPSWVRTSKLPMLDERGEVFGIFGSFEDITDRKRTETALAASEHKYRILVDTSQDLIWSVDQEGRYTFVNPVVQKIFGYKPEEMLGRPFSDFQPAKQIKKDRATFQRVLAGQPIMQYETLYITKEGGEVYLAFNATALRDENGQAIGATGTASDITLRKQAELELQKTRTFLESVLKNLPIGVIAKDAQNLRYVLWNVGAEKIKGRLASEVLGKTDCDLYPTWQAEIFTAQDQTVLSSGQMMDIAEEEVTIANGETRIFHTQKTVIPDAEGHPEYLLLLTEDITDRKRAADALRQSEARFQRVVANIPGMIYQFRMAREGQVSFPYVSSFSRELYGIEPGDLQANAHLILDLIHPDERRMFDVSIKRSAETLQPWEWTGRSQYGVRADGTPEYRWVKGIARPERQADGSTIWDGLVVDFTDRKQVEDDLRDSKQLLQLVMDTIPQLIAWKDRNSVYLGCNKNMAKVSTVALPQDIVGISDHDLADRLGWEEGRADFYRECDLQVMKTGTPMLHVVEPQLQAGGKIVWLDTNKLPLYDAEGNVVGILLMFEDITDRIRIEQDLRLYKRAVECSGDAIGIANASRTHIYQNPAFSRLFDCETAEQFCQAGGIPNIFADPTIAETVLQSVAEGHQWMGEVEMRSLTGRPLSVLLRSNVIVDEAGQMIGIVGAMMDISDRKRAEEALRKSEHNLRTVFNNVYDAIFIQAEDGSILDVNNRTLEMYGVSAAEATQLSIQSDYSAPENRFDQLQQLWQRALSGQTARFEWLAQRPHNGETFDVEVALCKMSLNNQDVVLANVRDISDRKRVQAALEQSEAQYRLQANDLQNTLRELQHTQTQLIQSEKMSSLGQLVAGVAHEINNPVGFIFGNLNHASDYTQNLLHLIQLYQTHYPQPVAEIQSQMEAIDLAFLLEDLPKLISSMRVGADRIQGIVASLRTFSRMDEADMKSVDIHEGIDSTLMILQSRLKPSPNRPAIEVVKTYGDLPMVECYAGQLNQVFMNLLTNAIDALEEAMVPPVAVGCKRGYEMQSQEMQSQETQYEPAFAPTIHIQTEITEGQQVSIRISDNGQGMTEKTRNRLFDPFFTTKPVGKGTGMGLSISYQIVTERHGGTLQCVSALGQGAEFTVEIPVRQVECCL